jgi:protein-disulfide isomerase
MIARLRLFEIAACVTFAALMAAAPVRAETFSAAQRSEIENIVKDYLLKHPEVLQEVIGELEKKQATAEAERHRAAVKALAKPLFSSQNQVNLGNPNGDVTMVEFFDYNCGYCKRAMADMMTLLQTDPKLKVVLKEFPVLGQASMEAAQVATAVRMQDKDGKKYLDFHQKLLSARGQVNKARALVVAREVGLDMARLEKDMASAETKASLAESFKLAESLGLNGTPSYVVGNDVVVGAIGLAGLKEKINIARCGQASC